jgi:hypothetical protein
MSLGGGVTAPCGQSIKAANCTDQRILRDLRNKRRHILLNDKPSAYTSASYASYPCLRTYLSVQVWTESVKHIKELCIEV